MKIQTINPATGHDLAQYTCLERKEIESTIKDAYDAFLLWRKTDFTEREKLLAQLEQILRQNRQDLALLMAFEMGKPISLGLSEIDKCVLLCEHYRTHAKDYLAPRVIQTEMKSAKVYHNPMGVVFGIMPWNYPFWQVFRFAVPSIMAGNSVLLKHAPITSGTGNKIAELFQEAGFPSHLLQHAIVDEAGAATIIEHPNIAAVTLTGSERAGKIVASLAGKSLKKSVLELGGVDPYLILGDADVMKAAQCIVASRLNNSGQVCIAAKRVIVIKAIEQELIDNILECINQYPMGNPLDPDVKMGPLARYDLRENLQFQVEKSVKQGAKLLLGGIIPLGPGFYYPPTVLTGIKPGMVAFDEELFGPVISIGSVDNEEEAIAWANHSAYGLGAAVFTRDLQRGERIAAHDIEAGVCFVNRFVASDPRLPFGGIKHSGYGRELSQEGILEFVNIKTVAVCDS